MKTDQLVSIVAGAVITVLVTLALTSKKAAAAVPVGPTGISNAALPGQPGWGWQYFSDGTVIGPDGTYYQNGAQVWRPQ